VLASKGIERKTLLRPSQVVQEVLGVASSRVVVLSGPSFAREVCLRYPTAVVAASTSLEAAQRVQQWFTTEYFRVYTSQDVVGTELGGALKNVIAIAAGVADGLGFGQNTRAALIARGLVEISRLGERLGAQAITFWGLAGVGDLVLTCTGDLSRNRQVGLRLGRGERLEEILSGMQMVAEGVNTVYSAVALAEKYQVEMPITEAVYRVLVEGIQPRVAVLELMGRRLKEEFGGL